MRCAPASEARGEPIVGTASTVTTFLLVECPGPWGVDALHDSRLPADVKRWLRERRGMRPLLIRRRSSATARVFLARDGALTTAVLDDVRDLLDLDLTVDVTSYDGPLFLVCTHGRHDVCCAERGRPLWEALSQVAPDETWQVSHIGGDRFAANVLVLPDGLYYGRLTPQEAPEFAGAHRGGRLDLEHLRGRTSQPFAVQAAEVFLRRHLDRDDAAAFPLVRSDETSAVFRVNGEDWRVEVERTTTHETLTCRSGGPSRGWEFTNRRVVMNLHE